MRDGITHLDATLYLPDERRGPLPAVVTLTPYVADTYHEWGMYFAARGLVFVIVDVRGRGNSDGLFRPFLQEAEDGHDVVEWVARQPFCDARVSMWGGSYAGYCQWATAKEAPPHLVTIVPAAAPHMGTDFPMRSNIFYPYLTRWLAFTFGRASQTQLFADDAFWSVAYRKWHESGAAFADLDSSCGSPSAVFKEWIAHPLPGSYWDAFNPTDAEYRELQIPILTITGICDDDQVGALQHYRRHVEQASGRAPERHFLVIGPWDHAGTRSPSREFGGVTVGPDSLVNLSELHLQWYLWTMNLGERPTFLKKRVAYYVMGQDRWRYADTLDGITARHHRYFVSSSADANDVFGGGSLTESPGTGSPDQYTYDPRRIDGPEVDVEMRSSGGSLVDQSTTIALRGRQLIYHSAPLAEDTDIGGFFQFNAWIALDRPDTDIYVSIWEIALDGSAVRLSTDAMRARYREGLRTPKLIQGREPLLYRFDSFTFVARRIVRGHRLRLIVAPIGRIIEGTFWEKNYNGGGIVAQESAAEAAAVTLSLSHDSEHPSFLEVPICASDGDEANSLHTRNSLEIQNG